MDPLRYTPRSAPALLLLLATGLTLACSSDGRARRGKPKSRAEAAYFLAEESLEGDNFLDAVKRYNFVRTRYPYSKYAALADLRLGDVYFQQERYATAIEQYRAFIKLHANHPRIAYADWRIAEAFYKQMPEDWFFLPPAYERSLSRASDAERELRYFLRKHKGSSFDPRARRLLLLARRRLADHEFYVATYYLKRDNPRAAAMRLTFLLKTYPGLGLDPPALFLLARSYIQLGDMPKATTALSDLIRVHPRSPLAARARAYMQRYKLTPR